MGSGEPTAPWRLLALGVALLATFGAGCGGGGSGREGAGVGRRDDGREDRTAALEARPAPAAGPGTAPAPGPGTYDLPGEGGRTGVVHVPPGHDPAVAAPLLVLLHGAGGTRRGTLELVRAATDAAGVVVVAPDSRGPTWDVILGGWGPDVAGLDAALRHVIASWPVDPGRVAIAGFSDGASYALSLGLSNGDLFTHVIAFSPGFAVPARREGRPPVFVTHGTADTVLPIDRTSRRIVPRLRDDGYDVTSIEFQGGHDVPPDLAARAVEWFRAPPAA